MSRDIEGTGPRQEVYPSTVRPSPHLLSSETNAHKTYNETGDALSFTSLYNGAGFSNLWRPNSNSTLLRQLLVPVSSTINITKTTTCVWSRWRTQVTPPTSRSLPLPHRLCPYLCCLLISYKTRAPPWPWKTALVQHHYSITTLPTQSIILYNTSLTACLTTQHFHAQTIILNPLKNNFSFYKGFTSTHRHTTSSPSSTIPFTSHDTTPRLFLPYLFTPQPPHHSQHPLTLYSPPFLHPRIPLLTDLATSHNILHTCLGFLTPCLASPLTAISANSPTSRTHNQLTSWLYNTPPTYHRFLLYATNPTFLSELQFSPQLPHSYTIFSFLTAAYSVVSAQISAHYTSSIIAHILLPHLSSSIYSRLSSHNSHAIPRLQLAILHRLAQSGM
jgi:hypothetical protein